MIATADLMDDYPDLQVVSPIFRSFGKRDGFYGKIKTISCFEDNTKVRERLENEDGKGCVLVVDGSSSLRCALLGDNLVTLAINNNWEGIIINGCIRDSKIINTMDMGVKALATNPRKSLKQNKGILDIEVSFGNVKFIPNEYVYCDSDGIVVSDEFLG